MPIAPRLKKWGIPAVFLLGAYFLYQQISDTEPPGGRRSPREQTQQLFAQQVFPDSIAPSLSFSGRVTSSQDIAVSTEVGGRVRDAQFRFRPGQRFSAGDILYQLDGRETYYDLQSRRAEIHHGVSRLLPEIRRDIPDAYEKWAEFFSSLEGLHLPPLPAMESPRERMVVIRYDIPRLYYEYQKNLLRYRRHTYRAPFDGVVLEADISPGASVGGHSRVGRILRTDTAYVELSASHRQRSFLRDDMPAEVVLPKGTRAEGRVERISPVVSPTRQGFSFFVRLEDPLSAGVHPGEYVSVRLSGTPLYGVSLPRDAIQDSNRVYCIVDGALLAREVTLAYEGTEQVYITQGLSAGDTVVVEPVRDALRGMRVRPTMVEGAAQ
ncbi:efflux RND transporter periplasmic adaptor subunit [Chitinivibrio alkaliphilus]|uniref:HlyD family secretion protein n=1 Tax=Chitinivibrio alkaliphilus ACht1 TaxID=1313304 RepID=U7D8S1_9BACT|nr:HlyD family efflux transporter periplasmic adaptor subunit [Chitinivibrio alkaliphilus]ERP38774.1 HlyD family secretion protein [Chitinivibrio alkaliphilus ACht1]